MKKKDISQMKKDKKNNTINLSKHRKRRRNKHKKKNILKGYLYVFLSLLIILGSSFLVTKNIYLMNKCTDLSYSVEHNFTCGLTNTNKLLRVQQMSLLYSDGETAMVEVSGLSKSEPHKKTSIKGNFRKDKNQSWVLEETYPITASIN